MRLCDPSCDRQTKSGPARARAQANELIEDASLMRERNAVAIIGHTNGGFAVSRASDGDRHDSLGVTDCVVEQVAHHLTKQSVVAGPGHLCISTCENVHATFLRQHAKRTSAIPDQVVEIERLTYQRNPGRLGAGKQEHRIDEARQSSGLLFDDGERFAVVVFGSQAPRERHLSGRANHRDRRPQFVGGIGHELSLAVKRRPRGDRADR